MTILEKLGFKKTEPERERWVSEAIWPNQLTGRDFKVVKFIASGIYLYPCHVCHRKPATIRYEIYDHTGNPQSSKYFCEDDAGPFEEKRGD